MATEKDKSDPGADLVEMAQAVVTRAEAGKSYDTRLALRHAAVGLRDVLDGHCSTVSASNTCGGLRERQAYDCDDN